MLQNAFTCIRIILNEFKAFKNDGFYYLVRGVKFEGEVNTSDLADPMIQAIMTSRRKKRANAHHF